MLKKFLLFFLCAVAVTSLHLRTKSATADSESTFNQIVGQKTYVDFVTKLKDAMVDKKDGNNFIKYLRKKISNTQKDKGIKLSKSDKENLNWPDVSKFTENGLTLISLPVKQLFPTQNEIGLTSSIKYAFEHGCKSYYNGKPQLLGAPIITLNKKYVLDGHHRWSQLYVFNPNAEILCYDFSSSEEPLTVLRKMQGAIASVFGEIPSLDVKTELNILDEQKKSEVENEIEQTIMNQNGEKNYIDDIYNGNKKPKETDRKKIKKTVFEILKNNIKDLRDHVNNEEEGYIYTSLPERKYMPQTSGPDTINETLIDANYKGKVKSSEEKQRAVISLLKNGAIDMGKDSQSPKKNKDKSS